MTIMNRFSSGRSRIGFWMLPFLWILLLPLVTVPMSLMLSDVVLDCVRLTGSFLGTRRCETSSLLLTYLPGAALIGAYLFFPLGDDRVRKASLIAGTIGLVRFVMPLTVLATFGRTFETTFWPPPNVVAAAAVSVVLYWLVTVPASIWFARTLRVPTE